MNKNNGRILIRLGSGKASWRKSVNFEKSNTERRLISSCTREAETPGRRLWGLGWGRRPISSQMSFGTAPQWSRVHWRVGNDMPRPCDFQMNERRRQARQRRWTWLSREGINSDADGLWACLVLEFGVLNMLQIFRHQTHCIPLPHNISHYSQWQKRETVSFLIYMLLTGNSS